MPDAIMDQAHGLRRLFMRQPLHMLPVVANPHVPGAHRLLEGLCRGLATRGLRCLVVDAAPGAGDIGAQAGRALERGIGLERWIERMNPHLSVLAADPAWWNGKASADMLARWSRALRHAAPDTDVVVIHAAADALGHLFDRHPVCPLVLTGESASSLTHAYAAIKTLTRHAGLTRHAVLLDRPGPLPELPPAATRLVRCVHDFLGGRVHPVAWTDSLTASETDLSRQLCRLSLSLLREAASPPHAQVAACVLH